jgi:hypothetical protein
MASVAVQRAIVEADAWASAKLAAFGRELQSTGKAGTTSLSKRRAVGTAAMAAHDPVVIDPAMLGVLYAGGVAIAADPRAWCYSTSATRAVRVRVGS